MGSMGVDRDKSLWTRVQLPATPLIIIMSEPAGSVSAFGGKDLTGSLAALEMIARFRWAVEEPGYASLFREPKGIGKDRELSSLSWSSDQFY